MINFEIPKSSIEKLSSAFRLMESKKAELGIVDYSLSQSTLEQVFLKQIRPNDHDNQNNADLRNTQRVPTSYDMWFGYLMWLLALFLPGLHHFYLGNTNRGIKYLLTANEAEVGWFLDLFEMHVLIQASVQEYGHTGGCFKCCPAEEVEGSSSSSAVEDAEKA
jgi:TM2 domain-containing membrane protein YozV